MEENLSLNFLEEIIEQGLNEGTYKSILTRFPPEPNGYLHIGHAKSICLNFGLAKKYGGKTNLRFDDTNPVKEDTEYVDSIQQDIRWLGFEWAGVHYASDYFEQLYEWAVVLIKKGLAYVDDQTQEEIRLGRGTVTEPGKNSPWRDRSIEENLDLFERMRNGEFSDGEKVLRAKIDMAHPNMQLRDPIMYRILHANHHRTGDKWCIYPMYDYAHGQSDSIEHITHSICTLEFDIHRPLYDWFIEQLGIFPSHQYEFARLNINYTVMSKRKLLQLVKENYVSGWDDPRMPTICGFRRRGYTPESIRNFCEDIGVAKRDNIIDYVRLENSLRDHLNKVAPRRMAVLNPVKLVIDNYPEGQTEMLSAINNPENEADGTRQVPFSRELYIEREDFMEEAPKKYFRLSLGREVRLRYAYFVTAQSVEKDAEGNITCIHCTYDPATRGGDAPDGRKVKGTLHWVSAQHAIDAEVRMFDRLFATEAPDEAPEGKTFLDNLNPNSLQVLQGCKLEPALAEAHMVVNEKGIEEPMRYQFERMGYFCTDRDGTSGHPVFNRSCSLKDTWAKISQS
jgi:glutaminyl-tRNA synthetase